MAGGAIGRPLARGPALRPRHEMLCCAVLHGPCRQSARCASPRACATGVRAVSADIYPLLCAAPRRPLPPLRRGRRKRGALRRGRRPVPDVPGVPLRRGRVQRPGGACVQCMCGVWGGDGGTGGSAAVVVRMRMGVKRTPSCCCNHAWYMPYGAVPSCHMGQFLPLRRVLHAFAGLGCGWEVPAAVEQGPRPRRLRHMLCHAPSRLPASRLCDPGAVCQPPWHLLDPVPAAVQVGVQYRWG